MKFLYLLLAFSMTLSPLNSHAAAGETNQIVRLAKLQIDPAQLDA